MGQRHLAFLESQAAHIEQEVYQIKYGDIQYRRLVPIDTSAHPFANQITWYTMDGVGQANFLATGGNDFPMVETEKNQYNVRVENLGVGYRWTEFELETAMMLNQNLRAERAEVVRRVVEEKLDDIVINGHSPLGWDGLMASSLITASTAAMNAAANSTNWARKTGQEIANDINNAISGIEITTLQTEMADTILLPIEERNLLATRQFAEGTDTNILDWIMKNNVYTAETGNRLTIMTLRGLETAGASGTSRMIVYKKDPRVLKLHMPMPLRFYSPQQWLLMYVVPAAFRTAGLEIRLPQAVRYIDGI